MLIVDNRNILSKSFEDAAQGDVFMYDNKLCLMTDDSDLAVCLENGELWALSPDAVIYPVSSARITIE